MPAPDAPNPTAPGLEPPSILVLTRDEAVNIAECLECLRFSDDVVVLDSHSTDRTVEIARSFPNVRVVQRPFDTEYKQRNFGLHEIEYRHPWLYTCDADERVTEALRDEILAVINDPANTHVAYELRYKNMFMDRWIRWCGIYPVWILRLVRPEKVRYEKREINVHPVVEGTSGQLREHFIHYSFNKGLLAWFHKHNNYSQLESLEAIRVLEGTSFRGLLREARGGEDRGARRRAFKNLSFHLPFRGFVRFLYMYFLKLGILNGRAGFHYAAMISFYEYWIEVKIKEHQHDWTGATNALVARMLAEPES